MRRSPETRDGSPVAESAGSRRRHVTGAATRERLMVTAERLFALRGVEGVSLREIQAEAGQANSSVITYHFGSKAGLVRALLEFRYRAVNQRRAELLDQARQDELAEDPRTAVWLIVRPLVESIEAGEMFVPFLAKLSANPETAADYLPYRPEETPGNVLEEVAPELFAGLPDRARRGRAVQLYSSVLNLLGELTHRYHRVSDAQLSNYVDGWVGMLTAPISEATADLMAREEVTRKRGNEARPTP